MRRTRSSTRTSRGFTLLEVMIGLALLGLALTVLLKSAANSIFNARQSQMMGVVTELARSKMYDLEEELLKDGFSETGLSAPDDECTNWEGFDEEGWPNVKWCKKIEQVELPSFDKLQEMQQRSAMAGSGAGSGMGSGSAGDAAAGGGFGDSALGGMLSMLGGGFGGSNSGDMDAANGASFVQGQYSLVQQVLKDSIRKVTLFLEWEVMGSKRTLKVVAFFTDPAAMDKALQGLGSQELPEGGASGGSSGGSSGGKGGSSGGKGGSSGGSSGGKGGT